VFVYEISLCAVVINEMVGTNVYNSCVVVLFVECQTLETELCNR